MKQSTFGALFALLLFAQPTFCQDKIMIEKSDFRDSTFTEILNSVNNFPNYSGNDLGLTYSKKKSIFKIWSPPAKSVYFSLYEQGIEGPLLDRKKMKKGSNGTWSLKYKGDLEGKFYTFQVDLGDTLLLETPDPYAIATGVNGQRAMVVDLAKTNPAGWENDRRPPLKSFSDIILYELHLRDISMHPNSGIQHKGKFLGLAETGTKNPDNLATGLDHIKELGVTHVHLLPSYDFMSIDEMLLALNKYNWGYDPQNYNVPEGSYATDPYDGRVRIKEFKELIKTLHDNGIRVIMDVVYNHTGATEESVFNQLVPYYYYRTDGFIYSNASACGNETASERYMMRKFMIESMKYWATEYHIDGFRIDLMGIHDTETINLLTDELKKIDPTIFVYGEGWAANKSTLPPAKRALKENANQLKSAALFSDEMRDGIKGHVFTPNAKGFINGEINLEESVKFGIVGAIKHPQVKYEKINYTQLPWANEPVQCINYASCHDNHTLWDRLLLSCPKDEEETLLKMNKLAQTIVLTSQGIPFLHAGEEFVRTKSKVENSFKSNDRINQIDWDNKLKYNDLYKYYQALIQLRKDHPAFRMGNAEAVRRHLTFLETKQDNIIGYVINGEAVGDSWKRILVIFNGQKVGKQVDIPEGNWKIICHNYQIKLDGMGNNPTPTANLMPYGAYILAEE